MAIHIGISGWRYAPWRGVFYPERLPQRGELEYAAGRFGSIEINGSFYSLQSPKSWQAWHDATPEGFVFAVKGPRYLTHMLRLREFERPLANFLASGLLKLGERLGPILWQLPPNFAFDAERLDAFLSALPRDTAEALAMLERHGVALVVADTAGKFPYFEQRTVRRAGADAGYFVSERLTPSRPADRLLASPPCASLMRRRTSLAESA